MSWVEPLLYIFAVAVFPGFVFLSLLGTFTEWIERKVAARAQNRMGPTYVGPAGLLQPIADILKLLWTKELVISRGFPWCVTLFLVSTGAAALSAATLLMPISPIRFSAPLDSLVLAYVLFYSTLGFLAIGFSSPSPFGAVGSSRMLSIVCVVEPATAISIFAISAAITGMGNASVSEAMAVQVGLQHFPAIALGGVSLFLVMMAKSLMKPFDIPEAETEVAGGLIADVGGPLLGMFRILHDMEAAFLALLLTLLVLRGPYPFGYADPLGWVLIGVKFVLTVLAATALSASLGRLRIEQGVALLGKYSLVVSILALTVAALNYYVAV